MQLRNGSVVRNVLLSASLAVLMTACSRENSAAAAARDKACAGPARTNEERQAAYEQGYAINEDFRCIDRQSLEAAQRMKAENERARKQAAEAHSSVSALRNELALRAARERIATAVTMPASGTPLPSPPPELFIRSDYRNPQDRTLAAYVTPDQGPP